MTGPFPLVVIGASAGGLETCDQIVGDLPPDSGIAYVYLPHLDPHHESFLSHLLSKKARIPVVEIREGLRVAPNSVYVATPGVSVRLEGRAFRLSPRPSDPSLHLPIDSFFESVAKEWGSKAIGIVLSGLGSDGTRGLRAIKAGGGITIAQDPATSKYDSMPRSAIEAGVVDRVIPAVDIAREVLRVARHEYLRPASKAATALLSEGEIRPILERLRESHGLDFSQYKQSTLQRRITRRLAVHGLARASDYLAYLDKNRHEVEGLLEDLLIHVTSFFRDAATFEGLCESVFSGILESKRPGDAIRIWVPGCSTGEEAYSLGIVLFECIQKSGRHHPVQILASDVSEAALRKARSGEFSEAIRKDVSDERLKRFFVRTERGYAISPKIREMILFVRHDVTRDPPFSRLDLISCRNLLIYLGPSLQKRTIQVFHFALNPKGYLLLSDSESIGGFSPLFRRTEKTGKVYVKKPVKSPRIGFSIHPPRKDSAPAAPGESVPGGADLQKEVDKVLLSRYVPATILVNEHLEILQFRGETAPYIAPHAGKAELHLLRLVLDDLVSDVRLAVHEARKKGVPVVREDIEARIAGRRHRIAIEVAPLKSMPANQEQHFLVLFRESPSRASERGRAKSQATRTDLEVLRLKNELALQKDSYRSLIEEYEVASEQLTSAHEEVLSTNEELQSANEELETAKEELQVGNEELSASNQELTLVNTDLTNFSASMGVASLMLSPDLRIRRITPLCSDVLKILPADVGRPLADIRLAIDVASLPELLEAALRRGTVSVQEVTDRDGRWYRVQVRPYRSADHKIEGAVLSFFDVDDLKKKEREADELRREAETLNAVGQKLAAELDVKKLVQVVTDAAASLTGAQFGAFFYSVTGSDGESYVLSTIPGVSREHFSKSPLPRNTALFEATSRGAGVVRLDDVRADPRYGTTASLFGEPKGQLPVASYLAVPVVSREGKVLGGLFFGHAEPGRFLPKHERLAVGLASQAAVAIDNARLYADVAQREQELSDFFENASVGCHWVGPDGTILRANRAELRMLGYSKAEYVGRHIAEFHVDRPVIDDILRRLAANEIIREYPARMRTKDGQIREVLIDSSVLWTDGQFVHTRCFTRDVTDLRRAQAADARLAALVASSDDPIVSKTLDGIITSWNKAAERMFGYTEKEVVGKSITVLFPEARLDEEREILAKLRRGESIEHYETERRRKDGSLVQVSLTVSPIRDAQGRILGASKIARDITERKRVEAEIRRLNADLERRVHERTASLEAAVRELDAFAYTIAHDLRAPLRAVHGFGQLLLEEYQGVLDEKAKGYVSQMIQGGSRMDALITDLLSYSRLNRQEVVLEALPLEVEVDRALEELKTDLAERGAVVAVKRPLPRVRGHAVTLKQAILNLVANAAKFVPPGTKPRITLWAERRPAAAAGARPTVRLWVEDNGIGIDPRYHDRLFRVFERLNPHEKYPGTGIGLAIVRRSIEKMGGRAGLESALGQGSRFWIELDAAEDAVASN